MCNPRQTDRFINKDFRKFLYTQVCSSWRFLTGYVSLAFDRSECEQWTSNPKVLTVDAFDWKPEDIDAFDSKLKGIVAFSWKPEDIDAIDRKPKDIDAFSWKPEDIDAIDRKPKA